MFLVRTFILRYKENGEIPVEEFLDSINPKMRAKIFKLQKIEEKIL